MRFLITRPSNDAKEMAQELERLGHETITSPVVEVMCKTEGLPDPALFHGLIITSRNTLRCLAKRADFDAFKSLPVFAVGPASARQAMQMGFSHIIEGNGGAKDLVSPIAAHFENIPKSRLFHPGGENKAYDLATALAPHGIEVGDDITYKTKFCTDLTPDAIEAIGSQSLDGVFLMSPRSAQNFHTLIKKYRLEESMSAITCLCLSQNVATALEKMPCKEKIIARHPNLQGIIDLI